MGIEALGDGAVRRDEIMRGSGQTPRRGGSRRVVAVKYRQEPRRTEPKGTLKDVEIEEETEAAIFGAKAKAKSFPRAVFDAGTLD